MTFPPKHVDVAYMVLMEYVRENPGQTIAQIAEALSVSEDWVGFETSEYPFFVVRKGLNPSAVYVARERDQ